jgi:hypothetical protein
MWVVHGCLVCLAGSNLKRRAICPIIDSSFIVYTVVTGGEEKTDEELSFLILDLA